MPKPPILGTLSIFFLEHLIIAYFEGNFIPSTFGVCSWSKVRFIFVWCCFVEVQGVAPSYDVSSSTSTMVPPIAFERQGMSIVHYI